MRITRKNYEKAKTIVKNAESQLNVVKRWEETVARLGTLGNQQLLAITVSDDGSVRTEYELTNSQSGPALGQSQN